MSAKQTLPAPAESGEDDDTAVEGREGTSIPGGGGDDASDSDDDLEVTWEVDSPEAARDVGVAADAAGGKPETAEPTGGSLREGTSPSSPSTVVSRGGSFRGGESISPPAAAAAAATATAATTARAVPSLKTAMVIPAMVIRSRIPQAVTLNCLLNFPKVKRTG